MNSAERLQIIVDYLKISYNRLSEEIGLSGNTKIYHIKNGRNEFSPQMAKLISDRYPQFSYAWILNDIGDMLSQSNSQGGSGNINIQTVDEAQADFSKAEIKNVVQNSKELQLRIKFLEEQLKEKEKVIGELKKDKEKLHDDIKFLQHMLSK